MQDYRQDLVTLKKMTVNIQNAELRAFVDKFMEEKVPAYFGEVAASSSGKYHPDYSLGQGGLVRHTIATVKLAMHICSIDCIKNLLSLEAYYAKGVEGSGQQRTEADKVKDVQGATDRIIAACILHDTFKHGEGIRHHTVKNHDDIAAAQIRKFEPRAEKVATLVETHMGQWGRLNPQSIEQSLVHLADYLASRKDIQVETSVVGYLR